MQRRELIIGLYISRLLYLVWALQRVTYEHFKPCEAIEIVCLYYYLSPICSTLSPVMGQCVWSRGGSVRGSLRAAASLPLAAAILGCHYEAPCRAVEVPV